MSAPHEAARQWVEDALSVAGIAGAVLGQPSGEPDRRAMRRQRAGLVVTVRRVTARPDGYPVSTFDGAREVGESWRFMRGEWSVQCFGKGALDAADVVQEFATSDHGREAAAARGFHVVVLPGEVVDLSELRSAAWEERAALRLMIGYTDTTERRVRRVASVGIAAVEVVGDIRAETSL